MVFDECPILANWSNIPITDDLYRNISMLGVAVANDDVVMMYKHIKDGWDINHNDTAIEFFLGDEDYYDYDYEYHGCPDHGCGWWVSGHTPLHIASFEGSIDAVQ